MTTPTKEGATIRAAAYVRVSTGRQATEGLSLEQQQKRVEGHIEARGWRHVRTFIEAGVSGRKDDRPALSKLLAAVDGGELDVVVIPKLDRFGRSVRQLHENFDRLDRANVELVSLQESIDTSTSVGRLLRAVLAALAEFESDVIGERVASVTAARARQGKHHGRPPYGYGPGMEVVEAEAAVVRRIYSEFLDGRGQRDICRGLDADNIPAQRGGRWHQGTVARYLANPVYRGAVEVNGEVNDAGQHEPIIDPKTWEKAAQLRRAQANTTGGGRGRHATGDHVFVKGHLRCGECGEAMIPVTKPTHTPGRLYEVYACYGRIRYGAGRCSQKNVRREVIDGAAWAYFERVALDTDSTRAAVIERANAKVAELRALREQADGEVAKVEARLDRAKTDYLDGQLSATDWSAFRDDLSEGLEAAKAQAARLEGQHDALRAEVENIDAHSAVLRELADIRAAVVGEAQDASREGVASFRASLRRLFGSFDLVDDEHGVRLVPWVNVEAIEAWNDGEPELTPQPLAVGGNNAGSLTT